MYYVDNDFYLSVYKGTILTGNEVEKNLKSASKDIDTLTFNRIVEKGFESLTEFQQNIIKEVICQFADFKFSNADLLENVLNSYSINGVSMSFNKSMNITVVNKVIIPTNLYSYLEQTGLTCRNLRC